MASVPREVLGGETKNTHWDTDAFFIQLQSGQAQIRECYQADCTLLIDAVVLIDAVCRQATPPDQR